MDERHVLQDLSEGAAQRIAEIIRDITGADGVAITDHERLIGAVGVGCDRHEPGLGVPHGPTAEAIAAGRVVVVDCPEQLRCEQPDCPCPLRSAVIAPLRLHGRVVGTVKLYNTGTALLPAYLPRLADGLSKLITLQLELAEADRRQELLAKARLEALQAQIRPHFLFNTLNAILTYSHTDAERARQLLVTLAQFFRKTLHPRGPFISLADELDYVQAYLALEQARHGERLRVRIRVEPGAFAQEIPALSVQPLVENAIQHGLDPVERGGTLVLTARRRGNHTFILVADNGAGMNPDRRREALNAPHTRGNGVGLSNVAERLRRVYDGGFGLRIRTSPGRGTAVLMRLPARDLREAGVRP